MKPLSSHRHGCAAAILIMAAMAMTACSSPNKTMVVQETAAAPHTVAGTEGNAADSTNTKADTESSAPGGLTSTTGPVNVLPSNRKLIRNADLSVETDQFDQLTQTITQQVAAMGGYIENSSVSGGQRLSGGEPASHYASITARIPQEKLDSFISMVEQSGNVTSRDESTTDVTLQYSDLESKKKTLTMEQDRIWALLEKADSLDAVIGLEKRLSEIRYELESMESQLRLYDNQVDYSTVNLNIREVRTFTPTSASSIGNRIQSGLSKNVQGLKDFFTAFLIFVVTTIPIWLPLLIIVIIIFILVSKRHTKKAIKKAAAAASAADPAADTRQKAQPDDPKE